MEEAACKSSDITCDPCRTVYDKEELGVGFCVQCVEYLCHSCVNHHVKVKATRSHVVLTGDSVPENKAAFEMLEVLGKCSKHPEEEIAYECKEHGHFLCSHCAKTEHLKCKHLIELALNNTSDSDRCKLSATLEKINSNTDKLEALEEQKKRNSEVLTKKRDEILDKQNGLRIKLEKALLDLQNQEEHIRKSFDNKLSKLNVDLKKIEKLRTRNQLYKQFSQATYKYGRPHQLYLVVNGHFRHIDDELQSIQADSEDSGGGIGITDIKEDVLNLLLTVDVSNHFYDNTSDSLDETQEIEAIPSVSGPTVSTHLIPDTLQDMMASENVKSTIKTPKKKRCLFDRDITASSTHKVKCTGDVEPCDIVGIALVTSNDLIAVIDYANAKLKIFSNDFNFCAQLPLQDQPCSICTLKGNQIAVLLTEKTICVFDITKDHIKQVNTIKLETYGHNIAKHGHYIAVMCCNSKYDGTTIGIQLPITLDIVDHNNGNIVSRISEFSHRPPWNGKEIIFQKPCQIYSRYGTEMIIGVDNCIKNFDSKGVQRWYFSRERILRGTTGITSDTDENIYVCGYKSRNIHQISSFDFRIARVIVPEVHQPWSIAFDKCKERLIVSCRKTNSLRTYTFL